MRTPLWIREISDQLRAISSAGLDLRIKIAVLFPGQWRGFFDVVILLTSKMSATIDQHIFNDISAKNTKNMHHGPLIGANTNAMKTIGADMNRPQAHISGSDFWLVSRNRCAKYDPSGTPMRPEAMATMPNLYATLQLMYLFHIISVIRSLAEPLIIVNYYWNGYFPSL